MRASGLCCPKGGMLLLNGAWRQVDGRTVLGLWALLLLNSALLLGPTRAESAL